jgi:VWFA-related protein
MMGTFLTQLKAFQEMAGALHHAEGRKTVIWLTGYFPVEVNDVEDSINIDSYGIWSSFPVKPASIDYQRTVNLLNDAQISIFPVQLAGSQRTNIGLQQIAQSTSGKVMASSDALERLVKQAEDRSTTYYLLAFEPEMATTSLKWTKLKVRLNEQSLEVTSPNGLFVFPPQK